jgi:hypothetical protein
MRTVQEKGRSSKRTSQKKRVIIQKLKSSTQSVNGILTETLTEQEGRMREKGRDKTRPRQGETWIYHLLVPSALNPLMGPLLHSNISLGKEKKLRGHHRRTKSATHFSLLPCKW